MLNRTHSMPSTRRLGRWAAALLALALIGAVMTPDQASAQQTSPTPPSQLPPYEGQPPRPGQIGLLKTSRAATYSELSNGLTQIGGCAPITFAVTANGQWLTFVGGTPPPFVNAPALAAMPTLEAGRGFFVRCEGPSETQTIAPIHNVDVVREGAGTAPSYVAVIVSGLPSGCARFDVANSTRNGDLIKVEVWNRTSGPGPCTAIYGYVTTRLVLPGEFVTGRAYTLMVNDTKTVLWVAGVASATAP